MTRSWPRLPTTLLLLLALALTGPAACSADSEGPLEAVFDQQREVLNLLDQHAENPAQAGAALRTWWQNNERSLRALKTRLDALPKDDPSKLVKLQTAHKDDIKAFNERLRRLRSRYPPLFEDAEVQAVLEQIQAL